MVKKVGGQIAYPLALTEAKRRGGKSGALGELADAYGQSSTLHLKASFKVKAQCSAGPGVVGIRAPGRPSVAKTGSRK